jgi:hypothetical protein
MAAVCKQHGPGRLPYADRREIGAGYAMATTAAVAAVTFVLVGQIPGVSEATTIGPFWFGYLGIPAGIAAVQVAAAAIPVVVPSAFVSGVVVWRVVSSERSRFGPVAGVAATGLTYPIGSLGVAGVVVIPSVLQDLGQLGLLSLVTKLLAGTVYVALFVGIPVFVFTFWLALPLGALGGSIYERTRTLT